MHILTSILNFSIHLCDTVPSIFRRRVKCGKKLGGELEDLDDEDVLQGASTSEDVLGASTKDASPPRTSTNTANTTTVQSEMPANCAPRGAGGTRNRRRAAARNRKVKVSDEMEERRNGGSAVDRSPGESERRSSVEVQVHFNFLSRMILHISSMNIHWPGYWKLNE